MIIITPEQFKEAFSNVVVSSEAEVLRRWNGPLRQFTDLMFGMLPPIADRLQLRVYREYYQIDAVFYEERDVVNFPGGGTYVKYINIVYEHENIDDAYIEIHRSQLYNTPLKVLVTYGDNNYQQKHLKTYASMIKSADIFSDFSTLRKQLVIFGSFNGGKIGWDFYVYKNGGFVKI